MYSRWFTRYFWFSSELLLCKLKRFKNAQNSLNKSNRYSITRTQCSTIIRQFTLKLQFTGYKDTQLVLLYADFPRFTFVSRGQRIYVVIVQNTTWHAQIFFTLDRFFARLWSRTPQVVVINLYVNISQTFISFVYLLIYMYSLTCLLLAFAQTCRTRTNSTKYNVTSAVSGNNDHIARSRSLGTKLFQIWLGAKKKSSNPCPETGTSILIRETCLDTDPPSPQTWKLDEGIDLFFLFFIQAARAGNRISSNIRWAIVVTGVLW